MAVIAGSVVIRSPERDEGDMAISAIKIKGYQYVYPLTWTTLPLNNR